LPARSEWSSRYNSVFSLDARILTAVLTLHGPRAYCFHTMKDSDPFARSISALVAASLLAGCADGSLHSLPAASSLSGAARSLAPGTSWMDPNAKAGALLYASDSAADVVKVFSFPRGKLVGTLTGLQTPQGMCVDKAGNVFITNSGAAQILKYAHGGTTPIATIADPGEHPIGCAVSPVNGDLAATNIFDDSYTNGSLSVYRRARGTPKKYTDQQMIADYFCGYDASGNLFVDGTKPASFSFVFAELPKRGKNLRNITLNQTIGGPGGVQWDGKYVAIADQEAPVIYQFSVSGSAGVETGQTQTQGSSDVVQFFIKGNTVVGPNATSGQVMYWPYPAGGVQTKIIGGFEVPIGTAISEPEK
jgi:DNA-binding beta-propeller fold protein YncE